MLAFDICDDELDFNFQQRQNTSSQGHLSDEATNMNTKEPLGLSRKNLQSDSEEESGEEDNSEDRHFKRRLRKQRK